MPLQKPIFRKIKESDNPVIAKIIRDSLTEFDCNLPGTAYADPATDMVFQQFGAPNTIYYVAEVDGQVVGGCGINLLAGEPDKCELQKLYLKKESRGNGIASNLLTTCIDFAKQAGYKAIYLETKKELKIAVPFYEKRGFRYLDGPLGETGHFNCEIQMLKHL